VGVLPRSVGEHWRKARVCAQRGELEERCGKVGGVKKCEKREARSEKREARSEKREAKKLYVLNNAPEIEVGAVV
jgi:hypothetical protein